MARNEGSHSLAASGAADAAGDGATNRSDIHDHHGRRDQHRLKGLDQRRRRLRLIFGLSALLCVLTVVLAPLSGLAVIGLVLGVVGLKMAKRVAITGKGVAIGGIVLSGVALALAITVVAGVTSVLNDESAVQHLEQQVQKLRDNLPDVGFPRTRTESAQSAAARPRRDRLHLGLAEVGLSRLGRTEAG
jgi:hypothetical protein